MRSKIVIIGGGTGNFSILTGLKLYKPLELTAIVSMMDDGGSTGILRSEFGILPPGDVRQCLIALSEESALIHKLFQFRFQGSLKNHSFGNLFHLALSQITGSEEKAIFEMSRILKITGDVVPVTLENVCLNAELEDGTIVSGETNIDLPKHNPDLRIARLFVEPSAGANPKALQAIAAADYIVISPGDLFTSTLPNFLVSGVAKAVANANAKRIYVCNLMTKHGETNGFMAADHVRVIHEYLNKKCIDTVIVNSSEPSSAQADEYLTERSFPVQYDVESILSEGVSKVIESDIMSSHSLIRHDPSKIAWQIFKLIQEDNAGQASKITSHDS
ncbi:MAG: YvcK family protein [Deltaproteobacteria bacterium]|nr:YvcK family protein [Deltaproteobacteria bacterium]